MRMKTKNPNNNKNKNKHKNKNKNKNKTQTNTKTQKQINNVKQPHQIQIEFPLIVVKSPLLSFFHSHIELRV
jgi:hypothetical protein